MKREAMIEDLVCSIAQTMGGFWCKVCWFKIWGCHFESQMFYCVIFWWSNWKQDYGFYGGGGGGGGEGQGSRMYRSSQRGFNEFFMEPTTPPSNFRRKNGEDLPSEFSPGLLDLHSSDTELLPEVGIWHFNQISQLKMWKCILRLDFITSYVSAFLMCNAGMAISWQRLILMKWCCKSVYENLIMCVIMISSMPFFLSERDLSQLLFKILMAVCFACFSLHCLFLTFC